MKIAYFYRVDKWETKERFTEEAKGLGVEVTGDFKILEVNRTAQFKYFGKRTGINVAEKILGL